MDNHFVQYMVDFTMPQDLPDEFVHLIPEQRAAVNRLLNEGKIATWLQTTLTERLRNADIAHLLAEGLDILIKGGRHKAMKRGCAPCRSLSEYEGVRRAPLADEFSRRHWGSRRWSSAGP
jgi:hypothetical protein